jgi:3-hydroxyacyl-[acyl-carrier-protein] dehydratase
MRFQLIDQITELIPAKSLRAVKNLTTGEEYLADHFPSFPVMPGVLMLEALVQSAAWLLRVTDDFAYSVVVLRELKSVKYGNFVEPGKRLALSVELSSEYAQNTKSIPFKGTGEVDGASTLAARFVVERYNLREQDSALAPLDEQLTTHYRGLYLSLKKSLVISH